MNKNKIGSGLTLSKHSLKKMTGAKISVTGKGKKTAGTWISFVHGNDHTACLDRTALCGATDGPGPWGGCTATK